MSRYNDYLREKIACKSLDEIVFDEKVGKLCSILFPEEGDYYYDDRLDTLQRKNGNTPMKQEYHEQVQAKRRAFGVTELASNGMPVDQSSRIFCARVIRELESVTFPSSS